MNGYALMCVCTDIMIQVTIPGFIRLGCASGVQMHTLCTPIQGFLYKNNIPLSQDTGFRLRASLSIL